MADSMSTQRPADIVSPTVDGILPNKVPPAEARKAGRFGHDKPTPANSIVLLVDHQIGLMAGVRDFTSIAEYKSNVVGLARATKVSKIPVLITSSNAQWQNGDTLPEIKEIFPDEPIYRRTRIINAYEDPTFRRALEAIVDLRCSQPKAAAAHADHADPLAVDQWRPPRKSTAALKSSTRASDEAMPCGWPPLSPTWDGSWAIVT